VKCAGGSFFQFEEESFYLNGPVKSDGSFLLSIQQIDIPFSISGTAPSGGANTWTGTYSIASSADCTVNENASFTATVLPQYDGIYSGTLKASGAQTHTAQIAFTSTFTQGAATSVMNKNGSVAYYLPLTAVVGVSGLPCFTRGSAVAGFNSSVEGEAFQDTEMLDDGSQLFFWGTFSDPSGSSLDMTLSVSGGACDHYVYDGTLTRQ
jgi:hypothetical protein